MIDYRTSAAVASERRRDLLAEAEATRLAGQARSHRRRPSMPAARRRPGMPAARRRPLRWPAGWLLPGGRPEPRSAASGKRTVLRDGSEVLIRPVQSSDAPLLADGFARLSARSRELRFLTVKQELSPAELRYLTEINHHDHEALGAVDRATGRGVGVARYVRSAEDSQAAELAVTVVDEWQGRGLGTELVAQLSERAREEGIRCFTALVAADNAAMTGLLRNANAHIVRYGPCTMEYKTTPGPAEGYSLAGVLRSSADQPGPLPNPTGPESAVISIVTETRQTKARRSADRLWSSASYSGRARRGTGVAGSVLSGSRMKGAVRWARCLVVLRGRDSSAAKGSVACGGPEAKGAGE
jgi:RimJ/RimL family protein N-acetyltransferase